MNNDLPGEADTPTPPNQDTPTTDTPHAAETVVNGERTEHESSLQAELDAERAARTQEAEARKKAETDAAYLQDENRRLKEALQPPTKPEPRKVRWGFYEQEV